MTFDTNSRGFVSSLPLILPLYLILPYVFVASGYRGLFWVWDSAYIPFWILFCLLSLLAIISCAFTWLLQDIGAMIFKVGSVFSLLQGAYLAMSERRHALLILVFFLFASGVLIAEKIKKVLRLPYHDSRRGWWESYPKGIPGVFAELIGPGGEVLAARLSNFGQEGCFVFSEKGPISFSPQSVRVCSGEGALFETRVDVISKTTDGFGLGLRFRSVMADGDWSKDLQDHLGYLRRTGYDLV